MPFQENTLTNRAIDIYDMIADVMIAKGDSWRNYAACRGLNAKGESILFFPTRTKGGDEAKTICAGCVVQEACHHDWLKMPPAMQKHGVWYGQTHQDRERAKRRRRTRIK